MRIEEVYEKVCMKIAMNLLQREVVYDKLESHVSCREHAIQVMIIEITDAEKVGGNTSKCSQI